MKRNIFLFVLLAIPFVIYFFLKFFGQSYYTIPIFYKEGVISAKCNIDFGGQYLIPDPVEFENGNAPRLKLNDQPTVFFVYSRLNPSTDFTFTEITRMVTSRLSQLRIAWIGLTDLETTEINEHILYLKGSTVALMNYMKCGLLVDEESGESNVFSKLVLVDNEKRIRGYYDGSKFEEYDRLLIELDILLTEK